MNRKNKWSRKDFKKNKKFLDLNNKVQIKLNPKQRKKQHKIVLQLKRKLFLKWKMS